MTHEIVDMDLSDETVNNLCRRVREVLESVNLDDASMSILDESISRGDNYEDSCKAIGQATLNGLIVTALQDMVDEQGYGYQVPLIP
jgi:hypothetical protein